MAEEAPPKDSMKSIESILRQGSWVEPLTKALSCIVGVVGALYVVTVQIPSRPPHQAHAYESLERAQPSDYGLQKNAILKNYLESNGEVIRSVSAESGVCVKDIEALIAASVLNPFVEVKHAQGYYGIIPMKPEKVGIDQKNLFDAATNIRTAVRRYSKLRKETTPEIALALFFDDSLDVSSSLSIGTSKHVDNSVPRDHCQFEGLDSNMWWFNNLDDLFTRDAVKIFYSYRNSVWSR